MPWLTPWSSTLCPYCFERFHLSRAPRRRTTGPRMEDKQLGTYWFKNQTNVKVELEAVDPSPAEGTFWQRMFSRILVANDVCDSPRKICPFCRLHLPHGSASGYLSPHILAIVGTRSSGKSNYFGVLLKELRDRYSPEVDFALFAQDSFDLMTHQLVSSHGLYQRRYGQYLYGLTPTAIDFTPRALDNKDTLRTPLIYRLHFPNAQRSLWARLTGRLAAMDLVIFDAAGEDLGDANTRTWDEFFRYLTCAAGIIFLIDPLQLPEISKQLPAGPFVRQPVKDNPVALLNRIVDRFQMGVAPGRHIQTPIAFAFAKSDLLDDLVARTPRLRRDSHHERGFNQDDCRQVSEQVESYLKQWGEKGLSRLTEQFAHRSFFALSALGQTPEAGTRLLRQPIKPRRVADPLLWLLWQTGYLPVANG